MVETLFFLALVACPVTAFYIASNVHKRAIKTSSNFPIIVSVFTFIVCFVLMSAVVTMFALYFSHSV